MNEHLFDLEERTGLTRFGFVIEPDGATATLSPREVILATTGGMELTVTHPNSDDHIFLGFHTMIGTVDGVDHRGEIPDIVDEMEAERAAGLVELGFVEIDAVNGFRWPDGAVTISMRMEKKHSCHFDTTIKFPNGNKLYVRCDFLVGKLGGVEWNDSNQRSNWGEPPSLLLTECA